MSEYLGGLNEDLVKDNFIIVYEVILSELFFLIETMVAIMVSTRRWSSSYVLCCFSCGMWLICYFELPFVLSCATKKAFWHTVTAFLCVFNEFVVADS